MPNSPRARFWRRALIATGLVVTLSAVGAWFALPVRYEAFAILKVAAAEPKVSGPRLPDPHEFRLFKSTQGQLVTSAMVLNAVLRDSKIRSLRSVREHQDDSVAWLEQNLHVSFPGGAEIMRIGMSTDSAEDSKSLVNKVVEKYLAEVVENDARAKMANEAKLQAAYDTKEQNFRFAADELRKLKLAHGTSDSEVVQLRKRLALDNLESELQTRRALLERLQETELESVLNQARASLPPETRTADPASETAKQGEAAPPAVLLERKQQFFAQKLAEADHRIAEQTQAIANLERSSTIVEAKEETLQGQRLTKNELSTQLERLKLDRLAPPRISTAAEAVLVSEHGDYWRRNVILGGVAACGLALIALGMAIGRTPA